MDGELAEKNPLKISAESSICKINLSEFVVKDYKVFCPDNYRVVCQLGELAGGGNFYPNTGTFLIDSNQQCKLVNNFEQLIPRIAKDLGISEEAALEKTVDFFSNSQLHVYPVGVQGKVYRFMNTLQNYIPVSYTVQAVSIAKTTGLTGFKIITQAPLTFVGSCYLGSIFFGYVGSVAGDNMVGVVFNATSYVLSRPMRGVEITLNGLILRPVSNLIGLPLILNGTQEILAGKGISLQEYAKIGLSFERICNSTVVKKATKIYRILRNKD
jgi:hypothetical protein